MAETTVTPDFDWSAFYYPQILEALIFMKRRDAPELTDESDKETTIQILRMFATVAHLNNVVTDMVANEFTLATARLPESIRAHLRSIGYELSPDVPARVDLVYKLSKVFTTAYELVPLGSQAATPSGDGGQLPVYFEAAEAVNLVRTDRVGAVFIATAAGAFTDRTAEAVAGTTFDGTLEVGGKLYIGHASIMWLKIQLAITLASVCTIGCWEFYDGDFDDAKPDNVTNLGGGQLRFDLTTLLGSNRRSGATVRVRCEDTLEFEDVVSLWDGSLNYAVTSLLGQSSPSTDENDYTVGTDWKELSVTDGTSLLDVAGTVSYALPQSETEWWKKTTVNGFTGFFVRFRCIATDAGSGPTLGLVRIDTGEQWAMASAVQGRSVPSETLGSGNGEPNQRFQTQRTGVISGSQSLTVNGVVWELVSNFLSSGPTSEHYKIEFVEEDRMVFVFGNGTNGATAPIGQGNIVCSYRYGATEDGNVGANTINVDKQSLTFVDKLYNPRTASGWVVAQSKDENSLETAKEAGAARVRTRDVAISPDDVMDMTLDYTDEDGVKPFVRAYPFEGGFGPKTIEIMVIQPRGALATQTQLDNLGEYFNGNNVSVPRKKKRVVGNQEVVATNYSPRTVNITATIYGTGDISTIEVANRLAQVFQPDAKTDDETDWRWNPNVEIPLSRFNHEIHSSNQRISKVVISQPSASVFLNQRELPKAGAINITYVRQDA
jgi:hypothetical protein